MDRFVDRWNAEDVAGMAACWLEAGDMVSSDGRLVRGREAVACFLGEERTGPLASTRASMSLTSVRALGPAVALLDADMVITGGRVAPAGEGFRMHVVMVAAQHEGSWWFEAVRPYALSTKVTGGPGASPSPTPNDQNDRNDRNGDITHRHDPGRTRAYPGVPPPPAVPSLESAGIAV